MRQRPQNFRIDRRNKLAKGLVFAGLGGQSAKTLRYTDSSGRSNHGTLTGMVPSNDWLWSQELGRWVLDFAGPSQYVSGPAWGQIATSISMCGWHKSAGDYTTSQALCGTGNSGSYSSGTLQYGYIDNAYTWRQAGSGAIYSTGASYNSDTWRHVAAVRVNETDSLQIFINGILVSSFSSLIATNTNTGQRFCVGRWGDYAAYYLIGSVADVTVHSRALSPAEIKILANRSDPSLGGLIQNPRRRLYAVKSGVVLRTKYLILQSNGKQLLLRK